MTAEQWKAVWAEFDKWYDRIGYPEWEQQKRKIQQLVSKAAKAKSRA